MFKRVGVKTPLPLYLGFLSIALLIVISLVYSCVGKIFFINYSPSVPVGLYVKSFSGEINKGDLVVFRLPESVEREIKDRSWFRSEFDFIKQVAAVRGDKVCAVDKKLFINEKFVGEILDSDYLGSPLPHLLGGCLTLKYNEFLPLGLNSERSFDGRYFGVVEIDKVIVKVFFQPIMNLDF